MDSFSAAVDSGRVLLAGGIGVVDGAVRSDSVVIDVDGGTVETGPELPVGIYAGSSVSRGQF